MIDGIRRFGLASLLRKMGNSPYLFKKLVSIYPPFMCSGIKVVTVSRDFRKIVVKMDLKWYNKNYVGTQFGGSLYSMTDPFYMIMLMKNLGDNYIVWDRAAQIEFLKPGETTVFAVFEINQNIINKIKSQVKQSGKYLTEFDVQVFDKKGKLIAKVRKIIYVREKDSLLKQPNYRS